MRTIKFRAWDKEKKEMWTHFRGIYYRSESRQVVVDYILGSDFLEVMQFTGLFDKNRKEIFEDDIVNTNGFIDKVEFIDGCFEPFAHTPALPTESKIIGNVWENPKLLNSK